MRFKSSLTFKNKNEYKENWGREITNCESCLTLQINKNAKEIEAAKYRI